MNLSCHHKKSSNHKGIEQERKKETEELQNSQKTINKMEISTYLSIITSQNGLNYPIKSLNGKKDSSICYL